MNLRTDHVAGSVFIVFSLLIFTFSGDLPVGRLAMPGAGFVPKLVAVLMIVFGLLLVLRAGRESDPLAEVSWSDLRHAAPVIAITAAAIALYEWLGFIFTMAGMMLALLVLVERRNILRAGFYSLAIALLAFGLFGKILRAPLLPGPFGF
jgi:uncharacterized membrane protein